MKSVFFGRLPLKGFIFEFVDDLCEEGQIEVKKIVDVRVIEGMVIVADELEDVYEVELDEGVVLVDQL